MLGATIIRTPLISLLIPELSLINFIPGNLFESIKFFIVYPIRVVPPYFIVYVYIKLVDCLEKCLIYGHIRRFAD